MGKLLLLFTVVPFVELYLLMWVADHVGFFATLGLVLLTGVLGAAMARAEGLRVLRNWQQALAAGQLPADGVMSGVLVLVGGVLLVTPGVLTDALGLALLFPPSRRVVAAILAARIEAAIERGSIRVVRGPMPGSPFVDPREGRPASRPPSQRAEPRVIDTEGETVVEERKRSSH